MGRQVIHPKGHPYPFDFMGVGDWIEVGSPGDADRIISAGNGHACKPHTQGRKYSRKKFAGSIYRVTRIA